MHNKYIVDPQPTIGKFAHFHLRSILRNLGARFTHPLETQNRAGFIVGCGHSGTTLVAAKIGRHPDVYLIGRETNAFSPHHGLHCSRMIAHEWDAASVQAGRSFFLEKTPKHVHSVERIWKVVPQARMILMLRNPLDNCASLKKRFGSLNYAVRRWVVDNRAALEILDDERVQVSYFENLVSDPHHELKGISEFFGLTWEPGICMAGSTAYDGVKQAGNMALRQEQVSQEVRNNVGSWKAYLTREEADFVMRSCSHLSERLGYDSNAWSPRF